MKLLMIDNYDSFTYNLVQYFGELGADVEVHRNDEITLDELRERVAGGRSPAGDLAWPVLAGRGGLSVEAIRDFAGRLPSWACALATRHRRGFRRQDCARAATDARQDQRDHDHPSRRLRRPAREIQREPLPLAAIERESCPR